MNSEMDSSSNLSLRDSVIVNDFHNYASLGDLKKVEEYINMLGNSLSAQDRGKALFYAAGNGHLDIVNTIIKQYGETIPQFERMNAFNIAVSKDYQEIVETILERFRNSLVEKRLGIGLEDAASNGYEGITKTLLYRHGDAIPKINVEMALFKATFKARSEIVEMLMHKYQDAFSQNLKVKMLSKFFSTQGGDAITHDIIRNGSFLQRIENTIEECKKHAPQRVTKLSGIILPFVSHASLEQRKIILEALTTMNPNHPFHIETKEHLKTRHNFYTKTDAQGQDTKTIHIPSAIVETIFKKAKIQIQGIPIHIAAQINKLNRMRVEMKEPSKEASPAKRQRDTGRDTVSLYVV